MYRSEQAHFTPFSPSRQTINCGSSSQYLLLWNDYLGVDSKLIHRCVCTETSVYPWLSSPRHSPQQTCISIFRAIRAMSKTKGVLLWKHWIPNRGKTTLDSSCKKEKSHLEKKTCQLHLTHRSFKQNVGAWWLLITVVTGVCVGLLDKGVRRTVLSGECDRASLWAAVRWNQQHPAEITEGPVNVFLQFTSFHTSLRSTATALRIVFFAPSKVNRPEKSRSFPVELFLTCCFKWTSTVWPFR